MCRSYAAPSGVAECPQRRSALCYAWPPHYAPGQSRVAGQVRAVEWPTNAKPRFESGLGGPSSILARSTARYRTQLHTARQIARGKRARFRFVLATEGVTYLPWPSSRREAVAWIGMWMIQADFRGRARGPAPTWLPVARGRGRGNHGGCPRREGGRGNHGDSEGNHGGCPRREGGRGNHGDSEGNHGGCPYRNWRRARPRLYWRL